VHKLCNWVSAPKVQGPKIRSPQPDMGCQVCKFGSCHNLQPFDSNGILSIPLGVDIINFGVVKLGKSSCRLIGSALAMGVYFKDLESGSYLLELVTQVATLTLKFALASLHPCLRPCSSLNT
jgi:hypothetical protein